MFFLGDIHGRYDWYLNEIRNKDCSVQLGDFGWGFPPPVRNGKIVEHLSHCRDLAYIPDNPDHKFICGNHDNRLFVSQHPNFLGAYGFNEAANLFYISGAYSTDFVGRVPGLTWWREEELSWSELSAMIDLFARTQPRVVVSHTAPTSVIHTLFPYTNGNRACGRTGDALDAALGRWQPEYWFFGHMHHTQGQKIGKTHFQCVGEMEWVELPNVHW